VTSGVAHPVQRPSAPAHRSTSTRHTGNMTTTRQSAGAPAHTQVDGIHGWRIVGYASVVLAMTAPGQSVGLSAFVDPLTTDLGLTRSAVSTAYLFGTLTGAVALPVVGRLLDRYGVRGCMVGHRRPIRDGAGRHFPGQRGWRDYRPRSRRSGRGRWCRPAPCI
jgi:hypothetical protein